MPFFVKLVESALNGYDCGAACLAMVLAHHGRIASLEEVRQNVGTNRDGSKATSILEAARWYGLRGRAVSLELEGACGLPKGAILYWEFAHFVVFERVTKDFVEIVDPALGRRQVSWKKFGTAFTGVALIFEKSQEFESGGAKPKTIWPLFKEVLSQSGLLSRIIATSVLAQLLSLGMPVLTGVLIDRVVPWQDHHFLLVLSLGALVLVFFQAITGFVRAHLNLHLRIRLDVHLTLRFLEHLVSLPYSFFQTRSTGDLMMRWNSNDTVREMVTSGAISALLDGAMVSLYWVLLLLASPSMALIVVCLGAARVIVFLIFRGRQRDLMIESLEVQAISQGYQVEMLDGIESLKAMGLEYASAQHWSGLFVNNLNVSVKRARLDAVFETLISALSLGSPIIIMCYGTLLVINGDLTLGFMLALNALAMGFLSPLTALVQTALQIVLLGTFVDRINDVMGTEPEQVRRQVSPAPPLKGAITLENVSFRYGPTAHQVVKDVSFEIASGMRIAVVGQSGSGKSTLIKLLAGLYNPETGRILYDGNDLVSLDRNSLRKQLGTVCQDTHLFGKSIRKNIALSDPTLSLDQVVRAAKIAHVDSEIQDMPMAYDTVLGERGLSLSGGQRQRLALARALVSRPKILLLDEATSALDAILEEQVIKSLGKLECTQIVIAHRLSTIRNADLILVMEAGSLVEQGSHDELLRQGGVYSRLLAAQRD